MSLSSQALWPSENHAVAHCWAMANRLKTSGLARAHFFVHRCFFDLEIGRINFRLTTWPAKNQSDGRVDRACASDPEGVNRLRV